MKEATVKAMKDASLVGQLCAKKVASRTPVAQLKAKQTEKKVPAESQAV
eukprot:CAMPEP_0182470000 /NCGR_PEP_ID=MMETSP1319-20130603/17974_1 /TAXON_ID=172717 /ORGANISM="Bolidomonas pacifica, Strain RCC208" /LENGTH=48 /DNA_ID= /DNA_START= /DNA_END= /DNA_ORIENTATION=